MSQDSVVAIQPAFDFSTPIEPFPPGLRDLPIWLYYKFEDKGKAKPSKVPYYTNGSRRTGVQGSPADRANLATYDLATEKYNQNEFAGIGFAILDDTQGIDLDGAIRGDDYDTIIESWAKPIIQQAQECGAYIELSPSGRGVHIIGKGPNFEKLTNNYSGVEAFSGGQFFTFTGDRCSLPSELPDITALHAIAKKVWIERKGAQAHYDFEQNKGRITQALTNLAHLVDEPRNGIDGFGWLEIGMCLHDGSHESPEGLRLWKEWSLKTTNPEYQKALANGECEKQWRSFKAGGGLSLGSLFHAAGMSKSKGNRSSSEHASQKGNLLGIVATTRKYQETGLVPQYWTNELDGRVMVGPIGDPAAERLRDLHEVMLVNAFHANMDVSVRQGHAKHVIQTLAAENKANPMRTYFERLTWDGTERLDSLLPHYAGSENIRYTRTTGRKWTISAVARACQPGCQADHMLILEGEQGIGKSQFLRVLGGEYYTEHSRAISSNTNSHKDFVHSIIGKNIVEMSELSTMRSSEMETLKAVLTTTIDDTRLSYERDARPYPRTCVFAGTTNELDSAYLKDQTGARRFWAIRVGLTHPMRIDELKQDRDQLWAEAVHAYQSHEKWWLTQDQTELNQEILEQQGQRQETVESIAQKDPWFPLIENGLINLGRGSSIEGPAVSLHTHYEKGVPTHKLKARADIQAIFLLIQIEPSRQTDKELGRVTRCLRALGFKKTRPLDNGNRVIGWELIEPDINATGRDFWEKLVKTNEIQTASSITGIDSSNRTFN